LYTTSSYLSNWIMFIAALYSIHFERKRATAK